MTEITNNLSSPADNEPQEQPFEEISQKTEAQSIPNPEVIFEQEIYRITTTCDDFIKFAHSEIKKVQKDKQVTGWFEINFQQNGDTLRARDISDTLDDEKNHLIKEVPSIITCLKQLQNDLDNINADLQLQPMPPASTLLPRAKRLETERLDLSKRLEIVLAYATHLSQSYERLCQNIQLVDLLPYAREKAGNKAGTFDTGYRLYRLASGNKNNENDEKTLDDYFEEATKQETLITNIKLDNIPKLAVTVIKEHVKIAIKAAGFVKESIEELRTAFATEYNQLRETESRITRLNKTDISQLLLKINSEAESLCKGMLHFHCKAHYLNKIYEIDEILQLLQFVQRAIKNDIQKKLEDEISKTGSPFNPATAANTAAEKFLKGPAGFWRGIKMLISLILKNKSAVNLIVYENSIMEALNTCDIHYGETQDIIHPFDHFIQNKLSGYDAPFPYNDLHQIMKTCLHDYSYRVEKFCNSFKIDISSLTGKNETSTLIKLIKQIEKHTQKLSKA